MQWITREEVRVGRMGCAWLIKRFVDRDAEFVTAPRAQVLPEAARTGATPFHAEGAALSTRGPVSSFEVILDHYGLTDDAALVLLGKIVGTADVPTSPHHQAEGPGLKAATEGILLHYPSDTARLAAGIALFDALYAYCQAMIQRHRPNGMFG